MNLHQVEACAYCGALYVNALYAIAHEARCTAAKLILDPVPLEM